MVRYFKKFDTRVRVMTGSGFAIPFEELTDDDGKLFEWGTLQTTDGYVVSELEKMIQRQVGGVQEIGPAEYESLKKKENQKLFPISREGVWPRKYIRELVAQARDVVAEASKPSLPEHFRGIQKEIATLARPLGVIDSWRPASVSR